MTVLKTPLAALAVMAGLCGAASAAEAVPATPFDQAGGFQTADLRGDGTSASDLLVQVRDGCGPGWHANRWGRCAPNRWGPPPYGRWNRPYYRSYGYYVRPWHRPAYGYAPPPWHRRWDYR